MSTDCREATFGTLIAELPKSHLPAGAEKSGAQYPFFCSSPIVATINRAICSGEAIIMGTGGDATVHRGLGDFSYSTDTWAFRSSSEEVLTSYLWRWLQYRLPWVSYRCFQGTGLKHLQKPDVRAASLTLPSRGEQLRIATVLDSLDDAIAKTETVIAKLKQVLAGLLHDLLTRGLDKHGQLRDPNTLPESFQDSKFGLFPPEWEIATFAGLLARGVIAEIQDGNHGELHPKESDYVEDGIPFVMASDIAGDQIAIERCKRIPRALYNRLRIGHAFPGDVLLSHKASVGFVARLAAEHGPVMLTPQVTYYRIGNKDRLDGGFLEWQMRGSRFQSQLQALAAQSTRDYVGITAQKNISVALPSRIDEQVAIISRLNEVQKFINVEETELSKLRALKSGLAADLFTGRVCASEALAMAERRVP